MGLDASKCCTCDDKNEEGSISLKPEGNMPGMPTPPTLNEDMGLKYVEHAHPIALPKEYQVHMQKRPGNNKLGIDIDLSDGSTLLVENITDGLVASWNAQERARGGSNIICLDDRIVMVNGVAGSSQALADRCVKDDSLHFVIRRNC
eukprot:TRINITY_DN13719_c0_g1_i1.p2 TRINITY_DN13719_c0_g1~~TRINITY_DN13719_c0_g1_i1.p2  ORF type:complete len:147 (-),score=28.29 TRINITY_DN13719_c0_g1_i1:134-574(-)